MAKMSRFSLRYSPPPNLDNVFRRIQQHGTADKFGYLRFEDLRSIALAANRQVYKDQGVIADLRNFLVNTGVFIEESGRFWFDQDRSATILECCDLRKDAPTSDHADKRLKFLKYRASLPKGKRSEASPTDATMEETMTTAVTTDVPVSVPAKQDSLVRIRWNVRCTQHTAENVLACADKKLTTMLTTTLGGNVTSQLQEIGLLIKHGDRQFARWEINETIAQQCRFERFPRANHRGISTVQEVDGGQMVQTDQWRQDLQQIASSTSILSEPVKPIVPALEVVAVAPASALTVAAPAEVAPLQPATPIIPIQYQLLDRDPTTLTDAELEEGMLAILSVVATLKLRHERFVSVKKERAESHIRAKEQERDQLDLQILDLEARLRSMRDAQTAANQELENLRASLAA